MDAQLKKGMLDACVLAAVEAGDAYGYRITQQTISVMHVSESALYPVLRRLETQGCFETYSQEHAGRLRKYYRMTPEGQRRLGQLRQELVEMKQVIDYIMEPGAAGEGRSS